MPEMACYLNKRIRGGRKTEHPQDMPDIVIPSFWKHGENKLIAISSALHDNQFTTTNASFLYIFSVEEDGRCNWLGNHTALLYLLWLLFSGSTKSIPASVVNIAVNKFAIKGVAKSLKETQSIASKIKPHLDKKEGELRGQYLTVYSIYEKAIL